MACEMNEGKRGRKDRRTEGRRTEGTRKEEKSNQGVIREEEGRKNKGRRREEEGRKKGGRRINVLSNTYAAIPIFEVEALRLLPDTFET